jgi:hypothetical protein
MSFGRDKSKDHQRALPAFAESEDLLSGGEGQEDDGLDIIESSRKDLDLAPYIDGQSIFPRNMHNSILTSHSPDTNAKTVARC